MVNLADRLKGLRNASGLTQRQVAQRLGLVPSAVCAYENGSRLPSYGVLVRLAGLFHVSTDYLLGLENTPRMDLSGLTQEEAEAIFRLAQLLRQKGQPPRS
jgi:transcriptional regulator with XRE-family HTH domain